MLHTFHLNVYLRIHGWSRLVIIASSRRRLIFDRCARITFDSVQVRLHLFIIEYFKWLVGSYDA